jgi:dephospho-CoA kinase
VPETAAGRRFLLVGLTGGIATGKSTVASMFRDLGCVVIDADSLAREVVEPGQPAYDQIVAAFGRSILHSDGRLDRKALGAIVFAHPAERARLESITHPRIRALLEERLVALAGRGFGGIVIFDAPVIVESGGHRGMDQLVVVVADEAAQVTRQLVRDRATPADATRRIRSQMPLNDKVKVADHVIDNSGGLESTRDQVRRVHQALLRVRDARYR